MHIATSLSITSLKLLQGSSILECSRGVRGEDGGGVRSSSGQEVEVEEWLPALFQPTQVSSPAGEPQAGPQDPCHPLH